MLFSILKQSFTNQKRAMALMILSVAVGTAVSASLMTIAFDIKGKVSVELRSFGANISIEPRVEGFAGLAGQKRYLREEDIIKAKTIFWRHNIIGVAPFLEEEAVLRSGDKKADAVAVGTWFDRDLPLPGEEAAFKAGVVTVSPWWDVQGAGPSAGKVALGVSVAEAMGAEIGDTIAIDGIDYGVSGLVSTGGAEDSRVFMDLEDLQLLKGMEGRVSRVLVSALTTPMDDFAYKDPEKMTPREYEKWYCTGYVTSISKQLEEVFAGSRVKPIWQVAETEGNVLDRMSVLVYLLTVSALLAAALGMSTTMAASLLRRLDEIGLMKSVGADGVNISLIFLAEALIIGAAGGVFGYLISLLATGYIGTEVFGTGLEGRKFLLLSIAVINALVISSIGSLLPIRRALRVRPAIVLKGGQ